MPIFDREAEVKRKEGLRKLEDRRVAFAMDLEKKGFMPERMFFCSSEDGSFVAIARVSEQLAVVVGPVFSSDEEFVFEIIDKPSIQREDVFEKGTGLNGAFGFGKKGARGFNLTIALGEERSALLPIVAGRTSWLEVSSYKKNPLLRTKRRRGDANLVWDFMPIEPGQLGKIEELLNKFYIG